MSPLDQDIWTDDGVRAYLPTARNVDLQGFKAIALACDNGATFPTSPAPTEGQWFLFEPGSRRVLYQRVNALWVPIFLFGTATITVAKTGNDSTGTGETGAPYLTWQKAFDVLPPLLGGTVTINIGAGIYTESPTLRGKQYAGNFSILIKGHSTYTGSPETITGHDGGTTGTNADPGPQAQSTITRSSGTWTAGAYRGMIVNIAGTVPSTLNVNRVIENNTTIAITLCDNALARAVDAADIITILPQSSIGGTEDTSLIGNLVIAQGQVGVVMSDFKVTPASGAAITVNGSASMTRGVLLNASSAAVGGVGGELTLATCFLKPSGSAVQGVLASAGQNLTLTMTGCYELNNGTGNTRGVRIFGNSIATIGSGTVIDGFVLGGVHISGFARVIFSGSATAQGVYLKNCTIPINAADDGFFQNINGLPSLVTIPTGTNSDSRFTQAIEFAKTIRSVAQAAPAAPLAGHLWNDSTQMTLMEYTNGIKQSLDGTLFAQTATVTVNSAVVTTTETTLVGAGVGTVTLPANWWLSGKSLRGTLTGVISTQAVPGTLRIKVKKGSTVLLDTTAQLPAGSLTNRVWKLDFMLTGRSATTVIGQALFEYAGAVIGALQAIEMSNGTTVVTIGTTSEAISVTAQWSAASLTDTISCTNLVMESLN